MFQPAPLDASLLTIGDAETRESAALVRHSTLAAKQALGTTVLFSLVIGIALLLVVASVVASHMGNHPADARLVLALIASFLLIGGFTAYYVITRAWVRPPATSSEAPKQSRLSMPASGVKKSFPRVIHQIWVGTKPLSDSTRALMQTIRDANPTFEHKLWGNDDVNESNFSLLPQIKQAKSYAQVADLMRLEILSRYGGVYFDTDFEGLSSIEPIIRLGELYDRDVIVCHEEGGDEAMSNSWIAARPGATAIQKAVNHLATLGFDTGLAENVSTGPLFWNKWYKASPYLRMPTRTFYPYNWNEEPEMNDQVKEQWARQGSFAIHHWAKSWWPK